MGQDYARMRVLTRAYRALVKGLSVEPDLRFREGVYFHQLSKEVRFLQHRPWRIFGLSADSLNPMVKSDFTWRDPGPHLAHLLNCPSRRRGSVQSPASTTESSVV
jgi:hypothetical protein